MTDSIPTQIMPAGGWRARFADGRDEPLVGWALAAGEIEPLVWLADAERVVFAYADDQLGTIASIYHPDATEATDDDA